MRQVGDDAQPTSPDSVMLVWHLTVAKLFLQTTTQAVPSLADASLQSLGVVMLSKNSARIGCIMISCSQKQSSKLSYKYSAKGSCLVRIL